MVSYCVWYFCNIISYLCCSLHIFIFLNITCTSLIFSVLHLFSRWLHESHLKLKHFLFLIDCSFNKTYLTDERFKKQNLHFQKFVRGSVGHEFIRWCIFFALFDRSPWRAGLFISRPLMFVRSFPVLNIVFSPQRYRVAFFISYPCRRPRYGEASTTRTQLSLPSECTAKPRYKEVDNVEFGHFTEWIIDYSEYIKHSSIF